MQLASDDRMVDPHREHVISPGDVRRFQAAVVWQPFGSLANTV